MVQLLHTPDGVRDSYGAEQAAKTEVLGRIRRLFSLYGYSAIQPPTYEYFDIFNAERGTIPSREMYKFFDHEGETLVLRPDFTPSIARCAAKYFMDEEHPIRLCYDGNTFINSSSLQGRLKESTQAGIELIGDNSPMSDAEVLVLTVDCLLAAGFKDFLVEVGQVDFFGGLVDEAGFEEELTQQLCGLIESKNYFGVDELLYDMKLPEGLKEAFLKLPDLFGDASDVLGSARAIVRNSKMSAAIDRLELIYDRMRDYGKEKYISFDLGMLSSKMYYTGIIFQAYTHGTGDSIVAGGRYDNLIGQFGKDAPSVGFGINVDILMAALMRQKIKVEIPVQDCVVVYDEGSETEAIRKATDLRKEGKTVSLLPRGRRDEPVDRYAREHGIPETVFIGRS
jgi:ATP phosphoribosyltransferase regulatory subunit